MQVFFDFIFRSAGNIIYKSIVRTCQFMAGSYYAAYIVKNQTDSNTYNNFQAECFLSVGLSMMCYKIRKLRRYQQKP